MSEWKKVRLGELCDFINGGAWSDKEYAPEGIPVLKVTNCKNSGFSLSELSYLPHSLEQKYIQNKLQRNDVIIATVGSHPNLVNSSAGRSVIVNSFVEGFYLNQNAVCIRTKDEEILDQLFWGYYSKYYLFQNYIQMRGKGAANQMRIAISAIKNYPMPLPPINVQRHIASILSRYDSLIENYQKQIKLLEEAAQRLYKEWFVDLHFPGHESTKFVDGVPEGWEKKSVKTIVELQSGYAFKSSDFASDGIYKIVTIKNVKDGAFDGENVSKIASIPEKMPKHCILEDGDILLSLTGNVGRVCIVVGKNYLLNQRVAKLKSIFKAYTYCLFRSRDMFIDVNNLANGAAQQNVSPIKIGEMKILIPENKLLNEFEKESSNYISGVIAFQSQIRLLTEARDRLLPKLMSGEIEAKQQSIRT